MSVQTYTSTLAVEICCKCHVTFGIPQQWQDSLRESHAAFYCPAGHSQYYAGKSDLERAQAEARRLERMVANCDEDLRSAKAAHAVTKGKLTKTKRRIANGVCPCCNRSFVDLHRHMAGQHPDFAKADKS